MALATDPRCGGAAPGGELAYRLQAIAVHESGDQRSFADPLLIGVNVDRLRGLPAAVLHSSSPGEARAKARTLLAQGRSFDLGLMQINVASLAQDGLSIETAFDACRNMAAGAAHFTADVRVVLNLSHRRYNTGSTERGAGYASAIETVLARIQTAGPDTSRFVATAPLSPPAPPPCAPEWDAWALAECSARPIAPSGPLPADGASSAPITTATKE
jgi:type IV secretion system protein VirB1